MPGWPVGGIPWCPFGGVPGWPVGGIFKWINFSGSISRFNKHNDASSKILPEKFCIPWREFISVDLLKHKSKFSGHGILFIKRFLVISGGYNFCAILISFESSIIGGGTGAALTCLELGALCLSFNSCDLFSIFSLDSSGDEFWISDKFVFSLEEHANKNNIKYIDINLIFIIGVIKFIF